MVYCMFLIAEIVVNVLNLWTGREAHAGES